VVEYAQDALLPREAEFFYITRNFEEQVIRNNKMINNKRTFEIYLILRFIIWIPFLIIAGIIITALLFKLTPLQIPVSDFGRHTLLILSWISCLLMIIDGRIKPAFVELQVIEDNIIMRTYNPHLKKWEFPFVLSGYKKRIKELKISREEYNDYKLQFSEFGLKKELRLQKINNNGVYESASINISLLGQRKYTDLILAIDRLKMKICLN
jgi:hypothetical protein